VRYLGRGLALGGLLVTGALLVLAHDAHRADAALHRAESRLSALQDAAQAGDQPRSRSLLRALQADARSADQATSGPLWDVGRHVPLLGRSLDTTAGVTHGVRTVADGVLPSLLDAGARLQPVMHGSGGRLDLVALRRAEPSLDTAVARLAPVVTRLDRLPTRAVLPVVDAGRRRVTTRLDALQDALRELAATSRVAPAMLGADGPRHYLVGFQNNSESRGTGGLLGAYAVVTADHGRLSVDRLGSDRDLYGMPAPRTDLGADYRQLYGRDAQAWQNSNLSGHFPYAAQLWRDMWQQRTGQRLDGVVMTDPIALGYLLAATGPVRLPDGTAVTSGNVVSLTLYDVYLRYAQDDDARKDFLVTVARAVFNRLLGAGAADHGGVIRAVARAAGERRFLVWSAHPAEQAALSGTAAAGEVPDRPGPFAFLVVNNSAGNKIDYFLDRSLTYQLGRCGDGRRESTVTVVLRNDVPDQPLPRFVAGRVDPAARTRASGSSSLLVSLYAARGAGLRGVTLDGKPMRVFAGRERGHPVFVLKVELPRGTDRRLVLRLVEPASNEVPVVLQQPLVRDQVTSVRGRDCR
jgi:hypothetical protein